MTGCQGTLKTLMVNTNCVNSTPFGIFQYVLFIAYCVARVNSTNTGVVDPPTVKVSVQVPTVVPVVDGPPMVKDTKSSLKLETNIVNNFFMTCLNLFLLHQCLLGK